MIRDSGGAGEWRGGLGFVRDYRILADEVRFSMRTDKHSIGPWGSDHGLAGGKGSCIVAPGTAEEKKLPSRFGDHRLKQGDLLRVERPGGGGLGDPLRRAEEKVLEDVRQGYVSCESAKRDYGVVVDTRHSQMLVDEPATRLFRGEKQKTAGNKIAPLV